VLAAATKVRASRVKASPRLDAKTASGYARMLKVLGDETRLRILDLVASAGDELCACEIESFFELSQPTISHHMRILCDSGLVVAAKRGQWVYYRVAVSAVKPLRDVCNLLG
jgi:ArsR family transcriptional regulator